MTEPHPAPNELIARREAAVLREELWHQRLRETLREFPVVPFGSRVVVLQRQPEHKSKGGILLPQSKDAPLSGYVIALPETWNKWRRRWEESDVVSLRDAALVLRRGDEVLFPDFAGHRISVLVGLEGEEQRKQEFLVINALDLHGKVRGGKVDSLSELFDGDDEDFVTGAQVRQATEDA